MQSSIQDEMVLLGMEKEEYYGLDSVASRIWNLLDEVSDLDALILLLLSEFDVAPDTCRVDVIEHLERMAELDLISLHA